MTIFISAGPPRGGVLNSDDQAVIVIGGSAGAVEALEIIVAGLPASLATPILIVVHIPAHAHSMLPTILTRRGKIPATHGVNDEQLCSGRIYVAPPDRHMAVSDSRVRLLTGARINRNRPSIDPLFISAARAYGPRTIAVLLSGYLDDGVAGLHAVKEAGGVVIVQDPSSTIHADMPLNAISRVEVDYTVEPGDIAPLLVRLCTTGASMGNAANRNTDTDSRRTGQVLKDGGAISLDELKRSEQTPVAQPTEELIALSCPDCGGVLMGIDVPYPDRFRCRVGHAFSLETLYSSKTEEIETALWTAIRALEEKAEMSRSLAVRLRARGAESSGERYVQIAQTTQRDADLVRTLLVETPVVEPADT